MELSKDTRDRIFAAADALYEQGGREAFPTVDAVRKTARVNMNDASTGMKEWRRMQTARAATVAVQVPAPVQQAAGAALATLWQEAQELANASLRAAQAGWEAERLEAETLNQQMADAYEAQAGELAAAQARIAELETAAREAAGLAEARAGELRIELDHAHQEARQARGERDRAQEQVAASADQVEALRADLAAANSRTAEIERRAGELRADLERAHQATVQARAELAEQRKVTEAAVAERDQVRAELVKVQARAEAVEQAHQEQRRQMAAEAHRQAERLTALQAERDEARKEAGQAREEAARLAGQLAAHKEQAAMLLARIQPTAEAKPATRKKPGSGE